MVEIQQRQELPLDGARGACRGQAQIRVPRLARARRSAGSEEEPMARILLGVSGGIAAYKALELARLATVAGHGVRVLMTGDRDPLRRRRLLRGNRRRSGAHLRVRARPAARLLPRRPPARARPDRPPRARRQLRRLPGRAGLGQHAGEARGGGGRLDADDLLPRLRGAAPRRPGDERPHVRGRRDPGQPGDPARARRDRDRARRGTARLARRARPRAASPTPRSCSPGSNPCCPPASAPGTGCGCWSPPAAPASRSTRSASSATAPAAAWASPSPPPPPAAGRT